MPDAAGASAAPTGAAGAAPTFRDRAMYALRSFVVYAAVMQIFGGFSPRPEPRGAGGAAAAPPARLARPLFSRGEPLDAHVFVTYDARFRADATPRPEPLAVVAGLPLATQEATVEVTHAFSAEARLRNATPHLHVAFARAGASVHEADETFDPVGVFVASAPLLRFYRAKETKARKRLLSGSTAHAELADAETEDDAFFSRDSPDLPEDAPWLPFFNPNVTVSVVDDFAAYRYPHGIPESMRSRMTFEPTTDAYFPTAYVDDFWVLLDKRTPLERVEKDFFSSSSSSSSDQEDGATPGSALPLRLRVTLAPQSAWKWQLLDQMERSFAQQRALGTAGEGDADEMKRVLLESDPRLLFVTGAVSLAHMVLETLAFKSDVSFWRKKKSTEGLSARTIVFNAGCQVVVLLYLLDNDTSWMVLLSTALSVLVEAWKITKVLDVEFVSARKGFVSVTDKRSRVRSLGTGDEKKEKERDDDVSDLSRQTAEHDETAMRYLTYLLIPLVLAYAGYSVTYLEHRGWYSFVVTTLVGAVYAFGFLAMLPQLFINYKLKSVAHMPWRQMTYKALNTVIDDLFAFVIKMPTLHRVAVFRDDVVFAAFLYQRWIYRVDKTRVNEFGFAGEAEGEKSEDETKKDR